MQGKGPHFVCVVHAAGFAEHCCIGLLPKKVGRKARHTACIIPHFVIHLSFICHSFDIHLSFLCRSIDTHLVIYLSCLCNVGSPSTIQKFPKLWQESMYTLKKPYIMKAIPIARAPMNPSIIRGSRLLHRDSVHIQWGSFNYIWMLSIIR